MVDDPIYPFLKWAGGKRSIIPVIISHLPENIYNYYEPFLGGGSVFFSIRHLILSQSFLSDTNKELILTYQAIRSDVEGLIDRLKQHSKNHSKEYYLKIRNQYENNRILDVASRFIYLNRTCFNGLYRVNKSGQFNVPMGNYRNPLICDENNLRNIANILCPVSISCQDFKNITPSPRDFVYCDPPYHKTFNQYTWDGFGEDRQEELKEMVDTWTKQGVRVMVSNSDTEFIRKLYKDNRIVELKVPRSISCRIDKREKAPELLILNY